MNRPAPRVLPLSDIQTIARLARNSSDCLLLFAGVTVSVIPPDGMSEILRRGGFGELGTSGGITLIKNAAAFTVPRLNTLNTNKRVGNKVDHFATVQSTVANDVVHDSFYPEPGDHIRPGMTRQEGSRTFQYYWRVSQDMSDLIRQGEQEHLNDARRAFELTYQLIGNAINSLAGTPVGPAATPYAAQQLAEAALAQILPSQLGGGPATWVQVLDRLLQQSKARDTKQWHGLSTGPPVTEGDKVFLPVMLGQMTKIGLVPSSQIVNY
jgi:hypothetical protein